MRRAALLAVLALTSIALAACTGSDVSAPHRDGTTACRSGYQTGAGFTCTDTTP